jgi:hypothetical protein
MNNTRVEPIDKGGMRLAIVGPLIIGLVFIFWMAYTTAVDAENLAVENAELRAEVSYLKSELSVMSDREIARVDGPAYRDED